jgi:hypothetical protein
LRRGDLTVAATADAFGIPWRPLRVARSPDADRCDTFEWRDLSRSLGMTPSAVELPSVAAGTGPVARFAAAASVHSASRALQKAVRAALWSLSDRTLLRLRQQALAEEVADLRLHESAPRRRLRVVGAA